MCVEIPYNLHSIDPRKDDQEARDGQDWNDQGNEEFQA